MHVTPGTVVTSPCPVTACRAQSRIPARVRLLKKVKWYFCCIFLRILASIIVFESHGVALLHQVPYLFIFPHRCPRVPGRESNPWIYVTFGPGPRSTTETALAPKYMIPGRYSAVYLCTLFNIASSAPSDLSVLGGCWDWTQDCCGFGIGSQML